ncbi:hypothetical protein E2C01_019700 [Portunus trituberculatus]|uniref:Uncharacterized protein n=1 Tax=Portunus trituberculatus TaxID=210409 RepID=A0A5B7DYC3_PORTR|nr:hypothetical protein [Portunus trituberculatus]MPC26560.1 hypothetical protein [Portunus trituberculatus]
MLGCLMGHLSVAKLVNLNLFTTGTHFYLEICVRLNYFIDFRKCLWRLED